MNLLLRSFSAAILFFALSFSGKVSAQLVGSEAFLQGDYIEVGIAKNGAFGTDNAPPAGYHARGVGTPPLLGFVSDPDKDGWAVGTPNYIGDYFLPGSPQEGWDMELNGVWAQAWRGSGGTSMTGGLAGTVTSYTTGVDYVEGKWEGTLGSLKIVAITKIKKDKLYFTTKVRIYNTGATTQYNFYYNRTVDPDNEVVTPGGGSFTTDNKIIYALPSAGNKTLVTAIGTSSIKAYLGLASRDCRAKPYIVIGGLTPTDSLRKMYSGNGTTNSIFKVDSLYTNDVGIGIVFKMDSLRAGDSTQLSYAYVLSTADVDSAFEELKPELSVGGKIYTSGDTLRACAGEILNIDVVGGDFYQWKWTPTGGLFDSTGAHIRALVGTKTVTYRGTAISDLCPIPDVYFTIEPILNPDMPVPGPPVYYCQYETPVALVATATSGSVLKWYTDRATGFPFATLFPNTSIVGSKYYYVSQQTGGKCESDRDSVLVITRALPRIDSVTITNPSQCGFKDGSITLYLDSANVNYTLDYDKDGFPATSISFTSTASKTYTITGLGKGRYTVFKVKNKYGCLSLPFYGPVDLKDPVPPGPPLLNNGPLCVGDNAILTAPSIAGATYSWTGPDGFSSTDQNPTFVAKQTSAGIYTLVVTVGPCVYLPSTTTLKIQPTPAHQPFDAQYKICEGNNLVITIVKQPAVDYAWSGNGLNQLNQALTIPQIKQNQAGKYYLVATNTTSCVTFDSVEVLVDQRLQFILPNDTTICTVDSAILNVQTNAVSLLWSPTDGLRDSTSASNRARPSSATQYTVKAISGTTCPDTSGKVSVSLIPTPSVKGYDTTVRMNVPYKLAPMYGQNVLKWAWSPSDSLSCSDCPNPMFNSSKNMIYTVKVTDETGCVGSDVLNIKVFCDGASVTMPNAFTPNGDGNNDIFYVRGNGFRVKTFTIFNRNGQEVFKKENFAPNDPQYGWNGNFGGQAISDAAGFVYMIEAICLNSGDEPIIIKGTVLMIK